MTFKPYLGAACPCPSDCTRHGNCTECISFHRGRGEQTYCEYRAGLAPPGDLDQPDAAMPTGREIRMLDYAPCAG